MRSRANPSIAKASPVTTIKPTGSSAHSNLIHEQNRAGIMVTHARRMTRFVDKVIQMVDGQVTRVLEGRAEIERLAQTSSFSEPQTPVKESRSQRSIPPVILQPGFAPTAGD